MLLFILKLFFSFTFLNEFSTGIYILSKHNLSKKLHVIFTFFFYHVVLSSSYVKGDFVLSSSLCVCLFVGLYVCFSAPSLSTLFCTLSIYPFLHPLYQPFFFYLSLISPSQDTFSLSCLGYFKLKLAGSCPPPPSSASGSDTEFIPFLYKRFP